MSEKHRKNLRATVGYPVKESVAEPVRSTRTRHVSSRRFKNKKFTLWRLKWATHLNNWNNNSSICARGTKTPEEYFLYLKYKNV